MKRRDLLRKIKAAAKEQGVAYSEQEGTRHTGVTVGNVRTTVPRHSEVVELTAQAIYKQLEPALGKGWWRK